MIQDIAVQVQNVFMMPQAPGELLTEQELIDLIALLIGDYLIYKRAER